MLNFKVREYKIGDSKQIYELFNNFTPYKRDKKFWVWINRMISDDKSLVVVAESEGKIVGHYSVVPQILIVKGVSYKVGFAIHAFVHPEFRNTFMIFQLTKMMYKIAKEKEIEIIYGFPNANFRDIQIKVDKWKTVALFKSFDKSSLNKIENNFELVKFANNYYNYYILSEILDYRDKNISKDKIYLNKNLNFYLNRYIRHPQHLYKNFIVKRDNKNVAFIVLKIYQNLDKKIGHLIDYISTEEINFQDILNVVENYFAGQVDKLSFWKFGENQKKILLKNGFEENGFETFLGIKLLTNNNKLEKTLQNFNDWELCMGDSDAF